MLPTDRWSWSTQDGTKKTPKDSFTLPENWHWEDEWYIDPTVPADEKVRCNSLTDLGTEIDKCWPNVRMQKSCMFQRSVVCGKQSELSEFQHWLTTKYQLLKRS